MIPPDLVPHIVSFLSGDERRAMGYDVAMCVRLKLPPAPLSVAPAFQTKLNSLQRRRMSSSGVVAYSVDYATIVHLDFVRDDNDDNDDYDENDSTVRLLVDVTPNVMLCGGPAGGAEELVSFVPMQGDTLMTRRYCWIDESLVDVYEEPSWITCEEPLQRWRGSVVFR